MRNKLFIVLSLVVAASMVLAACAPTEVVKTVVVEKEKEVVTTVEVEKEGQTVVVTATPEPVVSAEFMSKDPATFVVVEFGEAEGLDPALAYESAGIEIIQNIYETLIFYNKEKAAEFVPNLASEYAISEDGLTYTFTMNPAATFSDGTPVTAADAAYSIQRGILQGGTSSPQWLYTEPLFGIGTDDVSLLVDPEGNLYDDREGMQAADPAALVAACEQVKAAVVADDAAGTVTFNLAQAYAPFLPTLANSWGSVMSKAWVAANGGWDGSCDTWQNFYAVNSEDDPFSTIAMGSGPFMLESWTKGQELVLVRNPNYWRTEPVWEGAPVGPAALERVVKKSVTEWGTRFAMLQAGDADFASVNRDVISQVDPLVGEKCQYNVETGLFDACEVLGDQPLRLFIGAPSVSRTDVFLNFNIANPEEGGNPLIGSGQLDGNGIPPDFFSDIHVRKAFNYCFDWDTFIQDALAGEAIQSVGIPMPGMPGYDLNGPKYTYDLDKCAEEFQMADLDKDGIAAGEDPEGDVWTTGFRMQAAYNQGNTIRQTVAEILAGSLAEVNELFTIETIGLPWPTFLRNQRALTLPLFISGWIEDIHDPHNWYQPYIVGTYGRRQSLPEDLNAQFASQINAGVAETDPAVRAEIYTKLNQEIYDAAPQIILAIATGRHYEQRWVEGYFYNQIMGLYYYAFSKK
jgi:peptide/nickel transport system substrate-binding protein